MSLWVHATADVCAITNGTVHAVAGIAAALGRPTRCGTTTWHLVVTEHPTLGHSTLLWPPRVSTLTDDLTRCTRCFRATGRKSPRSEWPADAAAHIGESA